MPYPDMARAVLRKWWVFLPVLAVMLFVSGRIRATGAEYIAEARITVTAPRTTNTLLESDHHAYKAPAILAVVALYDDEYGTTLRDDGLSDDFDFDYNSEFPVLRLTVRAPTYASAVASAHRIADDFIVALDQAQADRDVVEGSRVRADKTAVFRPSPRPPASNRALLGLVLASLMVALGSAYGVDQFVLKERPAAREAVDREVVDSEVVEELDPS